MLKLTPISSVLAALMVASVLSGCEGGNTAPVSEPTAIRPEAPKPAATGTALAATPTAATTSTAYPAAVSSGLTRPADAKGPYAVTHVVDGDTDKVNINGRSVTLRLIGIDTPETNHPSKPVQCFGQEASARAKALLSGRKVWIEYDTSQDHRDRYGRDLVYVWLDDQTMINEVMVREGFAHEYTYDRAYRYQAHFRTAQSQAKAAQLGFWSRQTCSGDTEKAPPPGTRLQPVPAPSKPVPAFVEPPPAASVSYASCAAARAAGAAAIMRGAPGYASKLDGDHDGIACE